MLLDEAIRRVVDRGWFILGPELEAFEQELAAASGRRAAVGVGTGTDALALTLRGMGIGPGDEVITSPLSAAYTALAIMMAEARPVFADIDPDRLTSIRALWRRPSRRRTAAIMPVHLYGQPADMSALLRHRHPPQSRRSSRIARRRTWRRATVGRSGRWARPGHSASTRRRTWGRSGTRGAVITNDHQLADRIKRLRNGGQTLPLPSRRVRRELAARRDAGGHSSRAADAAAGVDGPPARAGAPVSRGVGRRALPSECACLPASTRATCITSSRSSAGSGTSFANA